MNPPSSDVAASVSEWIRAAFLHSLALAATFTAVAGSAQTSPPMHKPFGLVIHGGAGVILRQDMPPALEADYRAKLTEARDTGYAVLERGGTSLDAVVEAIKIMEDSPLFYAGKGALLNADV
ncbi:MAG: peptidase asparaginase 2, partial [Verrucomicrobia bacterium]|nr:peptidase asparaginase 2 [Verrucomicrobiota bacterium]